MDLPESPALDPLARDSGDPSSLREPALSGKAGE
jgi:hypothetical protein